MTSTPVPSTVRSRRRHTPARLGGLAGLVALSLLGVTAPANAEDALEPHSVIDSDYDGMPDAQEDRLLQKFAPKLYMHVAESFTLSNVDTYLKQTEMRFNRKGGCSDYSIIGPNQNTQSQLIAQSRNEHSGIWPVCGDGGPLIRSTDDRNDWSKDGFFLEHDGSQKGAVRAGDLSTAKIYGHAFFRADRSIELQYWFFYGYDELPGEATLGHQGDWEHIRLEVDRATENISRINYAAHSDGTWYTPAQITWSDSAGNESAHYGGDSTHPVVYAARGKHASYPTIGAHPVMTGVWDYTSAGEHVKAWEPGRVVNVGETWAPMNGQHFIRYGGLWGKIGSFKDTSGPSGPAFKPGWGSPQRVADPILLGDVPSENAHLLKQTGGSGGTGEEAGQRRRYTGDQAGAGFSVQSYTVANKGYRLDITDTFGGPATRSYEVLVNGRLAHVAHTALDHAGLRTYSLELDSSFVKYTTELTITIRNATPRPAGTWDASIHKIVVTGYYVECWDRASC